MAGCLQDVEEILVSTSLGRVKADLIVRGGNLVNVFTGEVVEGVDVAVKDGRIAFIGSSASHTMGLDTYVIDAYGKYVAPGFLDAHVHIESSMLTPKEFARAVLPHGATGVFVDPHEIANVLGLNGVKFIIEDSQGLPLKVFICIPSCVPASSPELETSGAEIGVGDVAAALRWSNVVGVAEVMNYPGVLHGDLKIHGEIKEGLKAGKVIDGHAPGLRGSYLSAYAASGISSCHESTSADEAVEKARIGLYVMVREGSAWLDLSEVIKAVTRHRLNPRRFLLATDDRHPGDIVRQGYIDHVIRRAIEEGVDPVVAIQMATINTAERFNVDRDFGAIAPGRVADIVILGSLERVSVETVIANGEVVVRNGRLVANIPRVKPPEYVRNTVRVKRPLTPEDLKVYANGDGWVNIRVIGVSEGKTLTRHLIERVKAEDGLINPQVDRDIVKAAVIERHKLTGNIGLGFVKGFNIKRGAIASTVAHDSHNIIAIGVDDADIAYAVNKLVEAGGGVIAVESLKTKAFINLPVAGLMSDESYESVVVKVKEMEEAWVKLGCTMRSPFMTMSLLSLPVLPELRITDKGIIDTVNFRRVPIVANSADST